MILLIDGYNLIKNNSSQLFISDSLRNYYVNQLNKYCKNKNHKAILVFDGGSFSLPTKEIKDLVTVIYSGYKYSADDVIKNYISDNKNKNLLLVSSDRALQKFAESLKIDFIPSQEFHNFLFEKAQEAKVSRIKKNDQLIKIRESEDNELDELMKQISNIAIIKEDDIISKKDRSTNSISKKDKKKTKKLNKL